ncbi:hypothetical membrane protein [Metamycoplasma arthritidis 158L3-1]|uniref:Hypothetical membrane protein n=1 Tax=Metamycoplasma arthritidis (strain 158L3-1) TaxID=243272 RepID=B3PM89_META1|nr:hypothetical membrane protein [Metamycoplasma arthritidis 158L3-1]
MLSIDIFNSIYLICFIFFSLAFFFKFSNASINFWKWFTFSSLFAAFKSLKIFLAASSSLSIVSIICSSSFFVYGFT